MAYGNVVLDGIGAGNIVLEGLGGVAILYSSSLCLSLYPVFP